MAEFHDRIVYFLGAGFSSPLGLPLMSNFIEKSKDLYALDPQGKCREFGRVYEEINALSVAKNFTNTDLFNIEEVLSLLEMGSNLRGKEFEKTYLNFIKVVIEGCSPSFSSPGRSYMTTGNWFDFLFDSGPHHISYGRFISCLMNLSFERLEEPNTLGTPVHALHTPGMRYGVVTTNYDMVLESIRDYIDDEFRPKELEFRFTNELLAVDPVDPPSMKSVLRYAKLHGSLDLGNIVPPTWNKARFAELGKTWALAYSLLQNANHLRILGYSLPSTDTNVRYLLTMGLKDTRNLKHIDVICLDPDESARERYRALFGGFHGFRFKSARTEDYLKYLDDRTPNPRQLGEPFLPATEPAHDQFFAS